MVLPDHRGVYGIVPLASTALFEREAATKVAGLTSRSLKLVFLSFFRQQSLLQREPEQTSEFLRIFKERLPPPSE
jgi:hypothetical protein